MVHQLFCKFHDDGKELKIQKKWLPIPHTTHTHTRNYTHAHTHTRNIHCSWRQTYVIRSLTIVFYNTGRLLRKIRDYLVLHIWISRLHSFNRNIRGVLVGIRKADRNRLKWQWAGHTALRASMETNTSLVASTDRKTQMWMVQDLSVRLNLGGGLSPAVNVFLLMSRREQNRAANK